MHTSLKLFFGLIAMSLSIQTHAQLIISPNQTSYQKPVHQNQSKNQAKRNTLLTLPFFDDFSTLTLDTTKWQWLGSEGIFINNEFGFEPISKGVATFDGFNEFGEPYDFSTTVSEAIGGADTLTSCPIDLSGTLNINQLYLTFYWQKEGFGEIPDSEDTLRVQFKDSLDVWHTVWEQIGGTPLDTVVRLDSNGVVIDTVIVTKLDSNFSFIQEFIALNNPIYLHQDFQFRFQASGRLSGLYDSWNVDYVVCNDNINPQAFFPDEIAVSKQPQSFLKRYSAMPVNQYFANPGIETSDTISTTINNFSPPPSGDGPEYQVILEDTISKTLIDVLFETTGLIPIGPQERNFKLDAAIADDVLTITKEPLALKTTFIVSTGDGPGGTSQLPNIDLRVNDTISSISILDDYYAYDDGTAEYGIGINQRFGQAAVKYEVNQADTLTDVLIHLTRFEKDLLGQTYNLVIWKTLDPDTVLYKVNVPIRYPNSRNEFLSVTDVKKVSAPDFQFKPIAITGTFYVGWEQTTNDRLTAGYDRNNDATANIFFNDGRGWQSFFVEPDDPIRQKERGSIMIRPVFALAADTTVTGVEDELDTKLKLYPNPADQYLILEGEIPDKIEILDLQGRVVLVQEAKRTQNALKLDISRLNPAVYVLRAFYTSSVASSQILSKRVTVIR